MGNDIHYRTCNICEASCGLEIEHSQGQVIAIRPDKADPLSKGHICPKGVALQDIQYAPERLRRPLKKTAEGWQEISWKAALDEVASKIKAIQKQHGRDAVGMYVGNPTAHNHGALLMLGPFIAALNTRSRFSATSCDQLPHMLACMEMFGHFANFPIPDIDRTDYFLCLGANPLASNGSVMTAPGMKDRLKSLRQRNGKFVLFDPRKTESAAIADEHHFIRPGTDALFLLAMLQVIFEDNLDDLGEATPYCKHLEQLKQACAGYNPEKVASVTGVEARTIRRLAHEFAQADSAAAYGRVGVSTSMFSGLNAWLLYVLNVVTGNLDRPGGVMFPLPAVDLVGLAAAAGETGSFNRWQSRVRGLPEFAGELPVVTMAEEILTPGAGQIKAMIIHAGNPVLSVPNGKLLDQAFEQLEFMVSMDIYLNETSRHADIILPPTGPLEHGHYELALHAVAVRNTVKYSPPLLQPEPGALHDWQMLAELTARLESQGPVSTALAKAKLRLIYQLGDEGMLDWLIRLGPYGKGLPGVAGVSSRLERVGVGRSVKDGMKRVVERLADRSSFLRKALDATAYGSMASLPAGVERLDLDTVKRAAHGIDLGPLKPMLAHRIFHKDGKVDLAPRMFLDDLARLEGLVTDQQAQSPYPFLLIGRRHVRCNNSWMHNSHRLVKGKNRCNLMMSVVDAERLNLKQGEAVVVKSRTGHVTLPVEICEDLMPGVVSMPHGWGHDRPGTELDIASSKAGVSMNDITDESVCDGLTGMAVINGVPVDVVAA